MIARKKISCFYELVVSIQYDNTYIINETQSTKLQNTTTTVKNPNWPEANQLAIYQLAIYKCSWEVEPGTTRIKFNE